MPLSHDHLVINSKSLGGQFTYSHYLHGYNSVNVHVVTTLAGMSSSPAHFVFLSGCTWEGLHM